MLVVDASAIADLLLRRTPADSVRKHVLAHAGELAAPTFFDLEVINALRRAIASRWVPTERADGAVQDLFDFTVERYPHQALLPRIWHLRSNFSPYDAAYLALAEKLADDGVPVLTTDSRFARTARKHSDVEVLLAA